MNFLLPVVLAIALIAASFRKVNCYQAFVSGAKSGIDMIFSVIPYLAATFVLVNLFRASGLSEALCKFLSPAFSLLGIPSELAELTLIRPFSGSGSLALLADIYERYGVDSYVSRCASVIFGSTETVFYVSAVYFSATRVKKTGAAIPIALLCNFVGCVLACALCRVL